MLFVWDADKAEQNVKKHAVSFGMAQTVFDDPLHVSILDNKTHREERWITMGQSVTGQLLVVIHAYKTQKSRMEAVRIISARRATRREKKQYEEGI